MYIKVIILLIWMGVPLLTMGQVPTKTIPVDSAKVYKALQQVAKKRKFSSWLFSTIFTIPEKAKKPSARRSKRIPQKGYNYYEGKIIRNIEIQTFDPFGYDIRDTSVVPSGFFRLTGNKLHARTLPIAIKNLLLFKQNQPFDSVYINESERLIRKQKYIHDVVIRPSTVKNAKDSVDILIRVLDIWSLTPHGSLSSAGFSIGFIDQNFMGTGQQFNNALAINTNNKRVAYETTYSIPNIKNTYVGAQLQYQINQDRSFVKVFNVERTFFSPFAKWGGGLYVGQRLSKDSIMFPDSTMFFQNFKFNTQDVWLAKSWRLVSGKAEHERTTNFIVSARFQHINYLEKPAELYDTLHIYSAERFGYFGLGITSRQYVQDRYIFKYGLVEDVPVGRSYGIIGGYQVKNNIGRWYLGLKASHGNYYPWGYLSADLEYGRFIHKGHFEEGALLVGFNYFSELRDIGRWKVRQFIKPQVIVGIKRLPTDKITINNDYGIAGFSAPKLFGIHKILLTLQTQTYAPWDLVGFKFGPYLVYSMGMLGDAEDGFNTSRLYSLFGLGVIIKNDFLIFKTFQISLAFYPIVPGKGVNINKFNAYKTSDFGFRDFDIEKPASVTYQ